MTMGQFECYPKLAKIWPGFRRSSGGDPHWKTPPGTWRRSRRATRLPPFRPGTDMAPVVLAAAVVVLPLAVDVVAPPATKAPLFALRRAFEDDEGVWEQNWTLSLHINVAGPSVDRCAREPAGHPTARPCDRRTRTNRPPAPHSRPPRAHLRPPSAHAPPARLYTRARQRRARKCASTERGRCCHATLTPLPSPMLSKIDRVPSRPRGHAPLDGRFAQPSPSATKRVDVDLDFQGPANRLRAWSLHRYARFAVEPWQRDTANAKQPRVSAANASADGEDGRGLRWPARADGPRAARRSRSHGEDGRACAAATQDSFRARALVGRPDRQAPRDVATSAGCAGARRRTCVGAFGGGSFRPNLDVVDQISNRLRASS